MDIRVSATRVLVGAQVVAAALLLGSCAQTRAPGRQDCRLRYIRWSGMSPGAGFTLTSVHAVEVDLARRRKRVLWRTARAPEPMLPHEPEAIAKLVDAAPWRELPADEAERLARLVDSWLATEPPSRYNDYMALGHEDGYLEQITVARGATTVTTGINPHGWARRPDPLSPPAEWRALVEALFGPVVKPGRLMPAH